MLDKIENMIREDPQKKMELKCLEHQIRNFRGISETDMIDSMCFSQPGGERVSTSNISDKTMKIGTTFRQRMEAINEEWYRHLEQKYFMLLEEIRFFEGAIRSIPGVEGRAVPALPDTGRKQFQIWLCCIRKGKRSRLPIC